MTTIRRHPPQVIDRMLDWCESNVLADPLSVLILGLPYVYGLTAHQLAAAHLVRAGGEINVDYPRARRAADIRNASSCRVPITEPAWLTEAAVAVEASNLAHGSTAIATPRSRVAMTASVSHVRALVTRAGIAATGVKLSCDSLASTRAAEIADAGLVFALADLSYADSYWVRLLTAKRRVIFPKAAA